MSALLRVCAGAVAVGLCCLPLGVLVAQQATDRIPVGVQQAPSQNDAANPAGQIDRAIPGRQPYTANFRGTPANGQSSVVETYFANCLLKHNQAEIELGQFAAEQSQNPQVKQFAQELVKDHQKVAEQLKQFASTLAAAKSNATTFDSPARTDADRIVTDPVQTPGTSATEGISPRAGAMQGGAPLMQVAAIEQKINDRCMQALREELQSKSGAEFDECFIGSQIGGHMHMLAALEVLSQESQGQLKQVADEARPAVQKHLEHAKQLAKQMKSGDPSSATAKRTTLPTERQ